MTAQQIDVHGLPASWMELADTPGNSSASAAMRLCARELQAALRQSGEAVYQVEFGSVGWLDTDKPTFDWWVQQGSRKCRLLYTTPPATSGLVEALKRYGRHEPGCATCRDSALKDRPVCDCGFAAALAAHDARGGR